MGDGEQGSPLTVEVERCGWTLIDRRHELHALAMTTRDRRELLCAVTDEVNGVLDRLPCGVPQVILDVLVDALHVAISELGRETDPFEYEDFYYRAMGICSET